MDGMVYWITGLSGAGKTTLGNALFYQLRKETDRVVLLDGNMLKGIVSPEGVSYATERRRVRARQYAQLCKVLADQGMIVICCTVSLYHDIQQWNRENLPGYVEIFLDVAPELLVRVNHRGLYPTLEAATPPVEFPAHPDITIHNTMDNHVSDYVSEVLRVTPEQLHHTKKFKSYWDSYYRKDLVSTQPSPFAEFVFPHLEKGRQIIDLGCGNGRDSLFFARNGMKTTAVDLSSAAIEVVSKNGEELTIFPVCDDFVKSKILFSVEYDYCYSRWTMHSIDEKQQTELLDNVYNALRPGGLFFIEARTTKDEICGLGEKVGHNAYVYNEHYRRFLDVAEFAGDLERAGFVVEHVEGQGFSKTEESDPVLLRVVARKPG